MILDVGMLSSPLIFVPSFARAAEQIGFGAMWVSETQHDPFLPGPLIAEHTGRLHFGTSVAISFARSPATLAYTAWDLAQASGGRFILGLGTQVKAHVERRFGMEWPDSVVGKLSEQLDAIRAFWHAWQTGEPLNYRGDYYRLSLMTPFFNPGPIEHPEIPIFIAGVNIGLARLAGQTADGFHVHPFHSSEYLRQVVVPTIEAGAQEAGRAREDVQVSVAAFAITNAEEREHARQQIAFYASTPSYRSVLAQHGWDDVARELSSRAARGRWEELPALISDEMLDTFTTIAEEGELGPALIERYHGLADRLNLYLPFIPGDRDAFWRTLITAFPQGS